MKKGMVSQGGGGRWLTGCSERPDQRGTPHQMLATGP